MRMVKWITASNSEQIQKRTVSDRKTIPHQRVGDRLIDQDQLSGAGCGKPQALQNRPGDKRIKDLFLVLKGENEYNNFKY